MDDSDKLVEMALCHLGTLDIELTEIETMKQNENWVPKMGSPKLKRLGKR